MWPHTLQLYLLLFAGARLRSAPRPLAYALETMAPPQCAGASDLVVSISDCAGLRKALRVPMLEDMHLYVESEGGIVCDSVSLPCVMPVGGGRLAALKTERES